MNAIAWTADVLLRRTRRAATSLPRAAKIIRPEILAAIEADMLEFGHCSAETLSKRLECSKASAGKLLGNAGRSGLYRRFMARKDGKRERYWIRT